MQLYRLLVGYNANMAPKPTAFSLADGDVALRSASAVFGASFPDPLFKLITFQSAS